MKRAIFFDHIRPLFPGGLQQIQVERIEAILDAWDKTDHTDNRWLAYALGTAHHESMLFTQYRELGGHAYFTRLYDITQNPRKAAILGNTQPGDGAKYCGRGPDGITGRDNYTRETAKCGVDLVTHPEKAEEPKMAAERLIRNMVSGAYRKHKLADFFAGNMARWVDARNIINGGLDKAHDIAKYAQRYYHAIQSAQVASPPPDLEPEQQYSVVTTTDGEVLGMIEDRAVVASPVAPTAAKHNIIPLETVKTHPLLLLINRIIPDGYGTVLTLLVWIGLNLASAFGVDIPNFAAMQGNETAGAVLGLVGIYARRALNSLMR